MAFDFRAGPVRNGSDVERFAARVMIVAESGCHAWLGSTTGLGYGDFKTSSGRCLAHRFAYETARGPIPVGQVVRHKCDVPCCVNPDHLELGSQKDNVQDSVKRGRAARAKGSENGSAKLTASDVLTIRKMSGSNCAVARLYGVHNETIRSIRAGLTWRHVQDNSPQ